jgi:hypothetical protein
MKTLSIVTVAIFLGLSGVAMAAEENCGIYCSNSTGPNPFMPEVSTSSASADSAYAQAQVHHQIVRHRVEK